MSFALDVKDDLLKISNSDEKADKLQLEAMIKFGGELIISKPLRLTFTCNNLGVMRLFIKICKLYYKIDYELVSRVINRFDNHTIFTISVYDNVERILNDINWIGDINVQNLIFDNEEYMAAYLRGAFLVRGSVNDPASKNSHLEIISTNEKEILFIQRIMNKFELNARISKRKNYLLVYLKAKQDIGDFLYRLGATQSMNYYEDVVITKEIKANAKRAINLDIANQDKTNEAALEQLKCIRYLEYHYPLEHLDSKLLMIMKVRKEHPEHSLMQLLDIIHDDYDPKLTKSGLNHRLRKLKELAKELATKRGENI